MGRRHNKEYIRYNTSSSITCTTPVQAQKKPPISPRRLCAVFIRYREASRSLSFAAVSVSSFTMFISFCLISSGALDMNFSLSSFA